MSACRRMASVFGSGYTKLEARTAKSQRRTESMDISDWRTKIDELDRKLAALLNERAAAVVEIGRLKRNTSMPIYEPAREREVIDNVQRSSKGPLAERDLAQIYERIIDVMRSIQKHEIVPDSGREAQEIVTQSESAVPNLRVEGLEVPASDLSGSQASKLEIRGIGTERRKR
jgi:chorismate mutase